MLLTTGPRRASPTLVLAHGAGAPMDSPFMETMARRLGELGVKVVRFEFPYMQRRREGTSKGAPDRMPVLQDRYRELVRSLGDARALFIGGKSMGGRVATMIADELAVRGVVALGYPFHPPNKPLSLRTAHLATLRAPCLIVQGTRDPFGTREEIARYQLSPNIELAFVDDGDHSFEPRKKSGRTLDENLEEAAQHVARFVRAHA